MQCTPVFGLGLDENAKKCLDSLEGCLGRICCFSKCSKVAKCKGWKYEEIDNLSKVVSYLTFLSCITN